MPEALSRRQHLPGQLVTVVTAGAESGWSIDGYSRSAHGHWNAGQALSVHYHNEHIADV